MPATATKTTPYTVPNFLQDDYRRSFFPLESTLVYIANGSSEIKDYIFSNVFSTSSPECSFLASQHCYALKDSCHFRKTLALDPFSKFYLYEFVWRHARKHFQTTAPAERKRFGYAFKNRKPLSPTDQFHNFRKEKYKLKRKYKYFAKVDISDCFNSFYHHDVQQFVENDFSPADGQQFGQFLREINAGTSVNCFPQGFYPAKSIGNAFLSFIEENVDLGCPAIIRFLDDVFLFADSEKVVRSDVMALQQIIGTHNLHLNSAKTLFGSQASSFDERQLDAVKKRLLRKREEAVGYEGEWNDVDLEEAEKDYIEQVVKESQVAEEDLELAIALIDEGATVVRLVELVCEQHPNLIKMLHRMIDWVNFDDDGACWEIFEKWILRDDLSEYELFWIAKIVIDHYELDQFVAEFLMKIYKHTSSTSIVKSVILECQLTKFGFLELKENKLKTSPSNVEGISALAGLQSANKGKRNQLCKYVSKSGLHMKILSDIISKT